MRTIPHNPGHTQSFPARRFGPPVEPSVHSDHFSQPRTPVSAGSRGAPENTAIPFPSSTTEPSVATPGGFRGRSKDLESACPGRCGTKIIRPGQFRWSPLPDPANFRSPPPNTATPAQPSRDTQSSSSSNPRSVGCLGITLGAEYSSGRDSSPCSERQKGRRQRKRENHTSPLHLLEYPSWLLPLLPPRPRPCQREIRPGPYARVMFPTKTGRAFGRNARLKTFLLLG